MDTSKIFAVLVGGAVAVVPGALALRVFPVKSVNGLAGIAAGASAVVGIALVQYGGEGKFAGNLGLGVLGGAGLLAVSLLMAQTPSTQQTAGASAVERMLPSANQSATMRMAAWQQAARARSSAPPRQVRSGAAWR